MKQRISLLAVSLLALAACGGDDSGASAADPWARPSAPGQTSSAVYFDLTVPDDDRLVAVSVDAAISAAAEIHEVVEADMDEMSDDMGSMDDMNEMDEMSSMEGSHDMDDMGDTDMSMDDGMVHGDGSMAMRMQELEAGLALTGGETVSFEPGGYHVMLPALAEPLVVGDEFDLTLDFENADDLTVTVKVLETAP